MLYFCVCGVITRLLIAKSFIFFKKKKDRSGLECRLSIFGAIFGINLKKFEFCKSFFPQYFKTKYTKNGARVSAADS